jgi:MYXO-CTERM domain-containing protein
MSRSFPWPARLAFVLGGVSLALTTGNDVALAGGGADPSYAKGASEPTLEGMDPSEFLEGAGDVEDPYGLEEALADGLELELVSFDTTGDPDIRIVEVHGHFTSEDDKTLPLLYPIAIFVVDEGPSGGSWLVSDVLEVKPLTVHEIVLSPSRAVESVEGTDFPGNLGVHGTSLVVVPGPEESRIAWRVDPNVDREALYNSVFLVDDRSGGTRLLTNRLHYSQLKAHARNPVETPDVEVFDHPSLDGVGPYLESSTIISRNCIDPVRTGACLAVSTATSDENGDFLYEPGTDDEFADPFAEASAYHHLDEAVTWLADRGFAGHRCHRQGLPLTITSNFSFYEDAQARSADFGFYSGACEDTISMGQGSRDASYDGDMVHHEYAHGVVETLVGENFGVETFAPHSMSFDSRAIGEGFADFFAASMSQDPQVGTYFLDAPRQLENDFHCPRDLTGEVHADGEVIAGALWEASQALGDDFFVVALDSLMALDDDARLGEYAEILVLMTRLQMGTDAEATVEAVLGERGLLDCDRVVPIDEFGAGGEHPGFGQGVLYLQSPEAWYSPVSPVAPPPVQFAVTFPDGSNLVTVEFDVAGVGQELVAVVRGDAPIEFSYERGATSVGAESEGSMLISGVETGRLVLQGTPGQTQYIALMHAGPTHPGGFVQAVRVSELETDFSWHEFEEEPEEPGSTEGTDDPPEDPGGVEGSSCACSSDAEDHPLPTTLLILASLGLGLGRLRRRS